MTKPVFGLVLGGILGALDGLTALVSAPETRPQIMGIVMGSTFKGLVAGILIGLLARRLRTLPQILLAGAAIGAFFAWLVTLGGPYFWEIVLPGTVVGLIVGFATFRHAEPQPATSH
jgi:hypothetical protein